MAVSGKKSTNQFFSATISIGSDEDFKVYCQPCDRDGPRFPAHGYCINCSEHLCETCFTVHRRHTLSRHHTLLDKTNMPQNLSPVTPRQPDNFTKPCQKHNIEMIKFYCHDHKALLCSVCVTLEHTVTSCKVNYIPDISGQTINSTDYQHILNDLFDMDERSRKILQDMRTMNEVSNKSLTEALLDIWKFRTTINERLDKMERKVKKALKVIQEDNNKNLKIVEKACRDVSKSLKAYSDVIKHFNASKQVNELFMELKNAEQMVKKYEQSVSKLAELEVKEYKFEPNEIIPNLIEKEESLGTLTGKTLSPGLKSRQCSHIHKICINTSQDNNDCIITGITFLTPDRLIITDYQNNAVKIVETSRKSVQYFNSEPWDVTSVSKKEVAVTFPNKETIQFFSVSGDNLEEKHTLKVDGKCYYINCHKDKIVVSYCNPAKVQIILINGTVLQTIQDNNIFKDPDPDNCIFISDHALTTVTKLNWQFDVTGQYVCTDVPRGLTMSDDGTVFVCMDNNTIEEISEDCSKGQVVVKDIESPQSVYWSADTCTLYTSSREYSGRNHFIKLFKFS